MRGIALLRNEPNFSKRHRHANLQSPTINRIGLSLVALPKKRKSHWPAVHSSLPGSESNLSGGSLGSSLFTLSCSASYTSPVIYIFIITFFPKEL
ncbi:hypothetical protein K1719_020619 [Acacia pycnantha]|nr:hypothetical protein K1719_020619 [Acacia pycnantha]